MLMMRPYCRSIIVRPTACEQMNAPVRFTSITFCHCVSVIASGRSPHEMPALLTRMSILPKRSTVASATAWTSAALETSQRIASTVKPRPRSDSTAGSSHSSRRAQSISDAPASASPSANSAPSPREPPVTMATRPERSNSLSIMPASGEGSSGASGFAGRPSLQYAVMRAIVLTALGDPDNLRMENRPDPVPGAGEAVVRLHAAALNRRDVWIRKGQYAGVKVPIDVGADVDASWKGREVVIDPSLDWGPDERAQGSAFNILGLPVDGTYAEMVKVPAANLHPKPAHLSWEEAAAVPLASVTAYRSIVTRARVQPGETVLVTGIGGGVATTALVIARQVGAKVYVTSGHESKIEAATRHGATGGVNHRKDDWVKSLIALIGSRPDVVIDGAGGETFNRALDAVKPGGRLVSYGSTLGAAQNVEIRRIFWKQLNVLGSTMGPPSDFAAMLKLYEAGGLRPVIDKVFPLEQAGDAHIRMEAGDQFGKIVLKIS